MAECYPSKMSKLTKYKVIKLFRWGWLKPSNERLPI